jgi:iron complex outermembrane recepter protein
MQNEAVKRAVRSALAGATSWLAVVVSMPASAQESTANPSAANEVQEVVVTGIRHALQQNLDMKRQAVGVVDVISSEDIGKFPDSNVAAALQRVPGVSIQRAGTRGEATGITVRGFGGDFNETLYDGRRISTAASAASAGQAGVRSVDFSTVGADFVGALHVLKSPDVTLSSSSIGATVNILYPKPFDQPGMRLVTSASGSLQDESGDTRPTFGALFSDTFADDTMGFLIDGIYTDRSTTSNRVFVSGWEGGRFAPCQLTAACAPGELVDANKTIVGWWQQQYGAEQADVSDKRIDGRIAFQWRPNDRMLLTIDDNYSRQAIETQTHGFALWFGINDLRSVQMDDSGTVVDFRQAGTPMDLNAGIETALLKTNQTGINLKYDVSERLRLDIDASYARSWRNPDGQGFDGADIGYGGTLGCNMGVSVTGDSSNHFPEMSTFGPGCDEARVLDPSVIGSHVLVRTKQENTDTIKQGRFAVRWEQDELKVDIGTAYIDDTFTLKNSNTFTNNFWQAYAGYGAPSGRTAGLVVPPNLLRGTIGTSDFIPDFSGAGSLMPSLLVYNPHELYAWLQGLGNPWQTNIPGFNYAGCDLVNNPTAGLCNYTGSLDVALDPASIQDIEERTWSFFVRANFRAEVADMPFHLTAGIRQERTEVSSSGVGRLPVALAVNPNDPTLLTTTFSDPQSITTDSSYSHLLPSLDMKLELTPEVHLRFNVSRTLTRPAITFLTPILNVGAIPRIGALTADGGNPELKPYLSDNFDLAAEWYYQPNSYAAINGFVKEVTNFIVQGTQRQTINDVIDPSTGQPAIYTVAQRVNGPDATVSGVEMAWQHVFGDSGFGFQVNATLVDTDKPHDPTDISQSGFAVTGLADSANFIGFYDRSGFETRVALNWRDEYLLQFGQNQNNSAFGAEATYVNSSLQIDFSTSYQVTDQFNVFFEALNVTDETQSTHGRFDNQMLDVFAYGRRYALGARFRM